MEKNFINKNYGLYLVKTIKNDIIVFCIKKGNLFNIIYIPFNMILLRKYIEGVFETTSTNINFFDLSELFLERETSLISVIYNKYSGDNGKIDFYKVKPSDIRDLLSK